MNRGMFLQTQPSQQMETLWQLQIESLKQPWDKHSR